MRALAPDLAAREAKLEALQEQLAASVSALVTGEDWRRALEFAAKFRSRSFNNTMLTYVQHYAAYQQGRVPEPMPTYVAGFKQWLSLNRHVMKGQSGYAILAPVTARFASSTPDNAESWRRLGRGEKPPWGQVVRSRLVGLKPAYVWDISQTDGDPIPETPRPTLLQGQAPEGLWDGLADQIVAHGFELRLVSNSAAIGGANGLTDYMTREVSVRMDMDDAAQVKTLAHDLLTAPTPWSRRGRSCRAQPTHRRPSSSRDQARAVAAVAPSHLREGADMQANDRAENHEPRDMTTLVVPAVGVVALFDEVPGVGVIDVAGEPVSAISDFLNTLLASGASPGSVRSYALALLRWWRFLAAIAVPWDRATRVEVRDFVLWMRFTANPTVGARPRRAAGVNPGGYAPATINHNLAVLRSFYTDRIDTGLGPLVNPVPEALGRAGQRRDAHHNPMQPFERHRRAPLRQKLPTRLPRSLPDHMFNALFAVLGSDRDRALVAFYVSTGARASELLGVDLDRLDVGAQRIGVHRKGSGRLQWLPASADAFVWLRLYQQYQQRPDGERALWLTLRAPHRPLSYPAIRRVLQRANDQLGTHWTLHDLRHTAADRMTADPSLSLTDVQWVLGHAHLSTTQIYLRPREDEVIARVLEHHNQQRQPTASPRPATPLAGGYRPEVLRALLGEAGDVG